MSTWILVIWFSIHPVWLTEVSYFPVVIGEYPTIESCNKNLQVFKTKKYEERVLPDGLCLEKPKK